MLGTLILGERLSLALLAGGVLVVRRSRALPERTAGRGGYDELVLDVLFVGIAIAFFALAAAFVRGCVRLAGPVDAEARR